MVGGLDGCHREDAKLGCCTGFLFNQSGLDLWGRVMWTVQIRLRELPCQ